MYAKFKNMVQKDIITAAMEQNKTYVEVALKLFRIAKNNRPPSTDNFIEMLTDVVETFVSLSVDQKQ